MTTDGFNHWVETTIAGKSLFTALGVGMVMVGGRFGPKFLTHGWKSVRTREWRQLYLDKSQKVHDTKVWATGWLALWVGAWEILVGVYLGGGWPRRWSISHRPCVGLDTRLS